MLDATSRLATTLQQLDVHFVMADADSPIEPFKSPKSLISGLASNNEARMRLALIPLFLRHPDYSAHALTALKKLTSPQRQTLRCFYTAAQLLQQKYYEPLVDIFGDFDALPNLFEQSFELSSLPCPDKRLHQLAQQQAILSNKPLNWYGTYEHAYTRLVRHTKLRQQWHLSTNIELKNS